MDRRTLLKTVGGAATIGAFAGCVGVSESDDESDQGNDTTDGSGTEEQGDSSGETTRQGASANVWTERSDAESKTLKKNVEKFEGQSPHSITASNLADLEKKSTSAIPAGNGPQLFGWAHDWVGDYYQRGFLSDQSGKLDVDLEETYTSAATKAVQFDGATVGLPFSAETVGLVYNKEMVDEPPETLAEMKSIMEEHHDPDNGTYGLSYPINPYFISAWAHAFGGYYYDEQADALGLTKEETLKGFRLVIEDLWPYSPNDPGYDPQAAVFAEGNAPFAINGPWYVGTVREKGIDVGVTKLPAPEGGQAKPFTGISLWYFTSRMDADEEQAEAARSFAEWYTTNEELHMDLAETHGFIPVLKELQGSDDLPEAVQGFSESVSTGTPMPTHPRMNKVWDPVNNAFTKALNGNQSLEKAFAQAEQTIRKNWE